MSIEVLPRARVVPAWPHHRSDLPAPLPALDPAGVRVPVTGRPILSSASIGRTIAMVVVLGNFVRIVTRSWGWALVSAVPIVLFGLFTAVPLTRVRARREPDLVLTPRGILVDGLDVPWWQVEEVLRLRTGRRDRIQYFVAVRVRDFVEVRGLSPFWAGLANLTRRRLVVLVETHEVADPEALVGALRHFVTYPEERELLATEPAIRLFESR